MYNIKTLNKISPCGLTRFKGEKYTCGDEIEAPEAILVRSASMHEMELPESLLAIARAAVANPPVLILDEATSSIDTRTESIIQNAMDSLMYGRTVFVIAHRLSTVRNSNAIMVLEGGKIIERGDHEDLIKQGGRYYQLYTGNLELE